MSDLSTPTSPKHDIIAHATQAAGGKPPCVQGAACQPCHRSDFQFLPVIPSVIPKRHESALKDAGYAWSPSFDAAFGSIAREATAPVARLVRKGYVFVYFIERGLWDVWQVMANGLTRKIMHQVNDEQYATRQSTFSAAGDPKQCSRGGANLPAHLISIPGALAVDKVWVAYSPRLWSPVVHRRFAANPDVDIVDAHGKPAGKQKLRAVRGREISPSGVLKGRFPASACLPLNQAALEHNLVDFCAGTSGHWPSLGFKRALEYATQQLDPVRFGKAEEFERNVRAIERASGPSANRELYLNKSLILMLPDAEGVAEQHNHIRLLAMEAKKSWAIGGPDEKGKDSDPLRAWKLRSSLHIDVIEGWAKGQAQNEIRQHVTRELNKNIPPVTEEDYLRNLANGAYPPGTTWEPLYVLQSHWEGPLTIKSEPRIGADGQPVAQTVASRQHPGQQTRLGRIGYPSAQIKQAADNRYGSDPQGRVDRYRGKLRMGELNTFRQAFKTASDTWDAHIARFDNDLSVWRATPAVAIALGYDFNSGVNLAKPRAQDGSVPTQVDEVIARMEAVDAAWGGGAASIATARELVALLNKKPGDPTNWIDNALLAPFNVVNEIANDPSKQKDSAEKIKGMIELPQIVKDVLHARRERLEQVMLSLMATREQALNIATSTAEADHAKALGLAAATPEQVQRHYKIHVRTAAVLTEVLNPSEVYATVRVKLPVGETLDAMGAAFAAGRMELTLESKNTTTRQERRKTSFDLRKLAGRPGLTTPEFYPVILKQNTLDALARQAARAGEPMVDVIADNTLRGPAQTFQLPKSVAIKLVAEQASMARSARQVATSRQGFGVGVVALFQIFALLDATEKIRHAQGYDYVDSLMAVFTASTGLAEGGLSLWTAYYDIRAQGSKLVLVPTLTRAAVVRLAAGVFGAAGSAFDAFAMWAKYQSRKKGGDGLAATHYLWSTGAYAISGVSLLAGTGAVFVREMSKQAGRSTVGAISEMVVMRLGGAAATASLGASLTGIGIVLAIGAFGWSLYAQNMEDDVNEVFLKRCYWGTGHEHGAFGRSQAEPPASEARQRLFWVRQALRDEQDAFAGLSTGFKAVLVWHDNWFSDDQLQARVESAATSDQRRVAYTLAIQDAGGKVLASRSDKAAALVPDADTNRYVVDVRVPMSSEQWASAHTARFEYNVYEAYERASLGRDTLIVSKKA